ncbi:Pkd2, partial [Drosophila busckii]
LVKNTKMSKIMYTTDEEVRDALTEFAVFIVFLVLTSLVTLSIRHAYMFYFNDTIKKLFTTRDLVVAPSVTISFEKLLTVPDWWDYLIYNFIVTLHGDMVDIPDETWKFVDYSPGETAKNRARKRRQAEPEEEGEATTSTTAAPDEMGQNFTSLEGRIFLHENLMLGAPRLRQIRVRKDSCYVNDAFIRYFNTCYADYASGVEEVGGKHGGVPYKTRQELDAMPIWTLLTFYNTGGYTVDLTYNKEKNLDKIKELKEKHWLDRGSRLCVLEFNLYNENTDTFQSIKLLAEIPPTGGVLPQAQLQTVKQFSFLTDRSLFMTVIYIFWYIMVVYYTIYEFKEMRKSGCAAYFKSLLNLLDALILLFCYLALGYNVWHTIKVNDMLKKAKDSDSYQSLDVLCFWNIMYVDMMAILAFLVWIKIFKFISFNKTLVQFTTTLKRCSKDLAGFSLMFGIVFLAYAQLGLLLFGTKHPDFRNFLTSILTMIRMILGDFQYNLIEQANRVLGPIYFLTYILLVFFILLNMFLAIIMETYNSVKSEITQGRSQLGAYIYKKLKTAFQYIKRCGRKNRRQQVPEQHEDPENFETAPTSANDTIKPELRNMSESEARYFQDVPPDIEDKDSYRLNNRVALLEEILEQLITNMDAILKRVEKESKKT